MFARREESEPEFVRLSPDEGLGSERGSGALWRSCWVRSGCGGGGADVEAQDRSTPVLNTDASSTSLTRKGQEPQKVYHILLPDLSDLLIWSKNHRQPP